MKRFAGMLFGFLMMFFISVTAHAEEYTTYYLKEVDMEINLPADCIVFMRDVDESHPGLAHFGFTADQMLEVMKNGDLYLDGIEPDSEYEIGVVMVKDHEGSMDEWGDDLLNTALRSRWQHLESIGYQCTSMEITNHPQTKFLQIDYCFIGDNVSLYMREYYTRYHGTMYGITLTTFQEELSEAQKNLLRDMIDSIRFEVSVKPDPISVVEYRTVYVENLDLEIELPTDYVAFTRDIDLSDPNLAAWSITADEQLDYLSQYNAYLNCWDQDLNFEMILASVRTKEEDLDSCDVKEAEKFLQSLKEKHLNQGAEWIGSEIFLHRQAKFFKCYTRSTTAEGTIIPRISYYTRHNGRLFHIYFSGYSDIPIEEWERTFDQIVYSIRFDVGKKAPEPDVKYRDELSGTVFPIPTGWVQVPVDTDFDGVKFVPDYDTDTTLLISCLDMYQQIMETLEKDGEKIPFKKRADFDLMYSNLGTAAEFFGCEESEVQSVQYGSTSYYYIEKIVHTESQTGMVYRPVVYLMRVENGIVYLFQYFGKMGDAFYEDFVKMLKGTQYTRVDEQDLMDARNKKLWSSLSPMNLLASLIITIGIYSLPIFLYRWVIRRYPVEKKPAKIITIVYAVFAFAAMVALKSFLGGRSTSGTAIFLWSWINYRVLIGGQDKRRRKNTVASIPLQETAEPLDQVVDDSTSAEWDVAAKYCHQCGAELSPHGEYCVQCGTPVLKRMK